MTTPYKTILQRSFEAAEKLLEDIDSTEESTPVGSGSENTEDSVEAVAEQAEEVSEAAPAEDAAEAAEEESATDEAADEDNSASPEQVEEVASEVETPAEPPPPTPVDVITVASDEIKAINAMTEILQKANAARETQMSLEKLHVLLDRAETVNEISEFLNDGNGFTRVAFENMVTACNSITSQLGIESLDFGPVVDQKRYVNLECLNTLVIAMRAGGQDLDRRTDESIQEFSDALQEALTNSRMRLQNVLKAAESETNEGNTPVVIGDNVYSTLVVDTDIPESLPAYLKTYVQLGEKLTGEYATSSLDSVTKAVSFNDALAGESEEEFFNRVNAAAEAIGDPRIKLSDVELSLTLPGNGKLFYQNPIDVAAPSELERLINFTTKNAAHDPVYIGNPPGAVAEDDVRYTRRPLTRSEIIESAKALMPLYDRLDVKTFNDSRLSGMRDLRNTIAMTFDRAANAPDSIQVPLTADLKIITEYLGQVYNLSIWPVYNYLINLIFTTEGFVTYAERSLASPTTALEGNGDELDVTSPQEGIDGGPDEQPEVHIA